MKRYTNTQIKHEKSRIGIVFLFITVIATLAFSFSGCMSEYNVNYNRIFETEYFKCINYEGEDTVTILELTDKGKEQETLIIPYYINGMKVTQIGGEIIGKSSLPRPTYYIESEKLKKVYVLAEISYYSDGAFSFVDDDLVIIALTDSTNICVYGQAFSWDISSNEEISKHIFVPDYNYVNRYNWTNYAKSIGVANIAYHLSIDENEKYYWIDNTNKDGLYVFPEEPQREGYVFDGWYLEAECVNLWDGTYTNAETLTLNLYAKWNSNI